MLAIRWYAGEAVRNYGDVIPSSVPGVQNTTIKQPIGVCAISTLSGRLHIRRRPVLTHPFRHSSGHALERELIGKETFPTPDAQTPRRSSRMLW